MAEPLSTSATVGTVAGWGVVTSALVGFITPVDYSIVFGAFTGSVFFIVTTTKLAKNRSLGISSSRMHAGYSERVPLQTG